MNQRNEGGRNYLPIELLLILQSPSHRAPSSRKFPLPRQRPGSKLQVPWPSLYLGLRPEPGWGRAGLQWAGGYLHRAGAGARLGPRHHLPASVAFLLVPQAPRPAPALAHQGPRPSASVSVGTGDNRMELCPLPKEGKTVLWREDRPSHSALWVGQNTSTAHSSPTPSIKTPVCSV